MPDHRYHLVNDSHVNNSDDDSDTVIAVPTVAERSEKKYKQSDTTRSEYTPTVQHKRTGGLPRSRLRLDSSLLGLLYFVTLLTIALLGLRVALNNREINALKVEIQQLRDDRSRFVKARPHADDGEHGEKSSLLHPDAFYPSLQTTFMVSEMNENYQDVGEIGDKLWDELFPVGGGYVRVPDPRRFDMPPSFAIPGDAEGAEIYGTSGTHQMHCLVILRDVVISYYEGTKSRYEDEHPYHCLDYLRQAVMCTGDTTLEIGRVGVHNDTQESYVYFNGVGSTHTCRDWNQLKEFWTERSPVKFSAADPSNN